MGSSDITIDMSVVVARELVVKGSFRYGVRLFILYHFSWKLIGCSLGIIHWLLL